PPLFPYTTLFRSQGPVKARDPPLLALHEGHIINMGVADEDVVLEAHGRGVHSTRSARAPAASSALEKPGNLQHQLSVPAIQGAHGRAVPRLVVDKEDVGTGTVIPAETRIHRGQLRQFVELGEDV